MLTNVARSNSALSDPKMSTSVQKRHLYTGNLNRETPGDSTKMSYAVDVFMMFMM